LLTHDLNNDDLKSDVMSRQSRLNYDYRSHQVNQDRLNPLSENKQSVPIV